MSVSTQVTCNTLTWTIFYSKITGNYKQAFLNEGEPPKNRQSTPFTLPVDEFASLLCSFLICHNQHHKRARKQGTVETSMEASENVMVVSCSNSATMFERCLIRDGWKSHIMLEKR